MVIWDSEAIREASTNFEPVPMGGSDVKTFLQVGTQMARREFQQAAARRHQEAMKQARQLS
jgi:hypothetical protein